ncbi:adenylate kinase [uncultured bacterium]|nr:adenylate kinase [uncultured bacterium]
MKKIVYIIGKPGAGKGTISQYLKQEYNFDQITASKILFEYLYKTYGKDSSEVKKVLEGQVIKYYPIFDNLIIDTLLKSDKSLILLDGYPRIMKQLSSHLILINANEITKTFKKFIVILDIDDKNAWIRISNRNICTNCNLVFTKLETLKCKNCSSNLVNRVDDNLNTFNNRIRSYKETIEVIEKFKTHVDNFITIDTNNKFVKDIADQILKLLNN